MAVRVSQKVWVKIETRGEIRTALQSDDAAEVLFVLEWDEWLGFYRHKTCKYEQSLYLS